jgi:hypothetical protein
MSQPISTLLVMEDRIPGTLLTWREILHGWRGINVDNPADLAPTIVPPPSEI